MYPTLEMCFSKRPIGTAISMLCVLVMLGSTATAQNQPRSSPLVSIEGVSGTLADNIRAHIGTPDERCNASQRRLNRLIPAIRRDVERATQALGFYQISQQVRFTAADQIASADTEPNPANGCWQLAVVIQAGEPVHVGDVQVVLTEPALYPLFNPVMENLPLRRGDQLNHSNYERVKAQLSGHAIENGFFQARFTKSELAIDLLQNQANIVLEFEPGERYRFGQITINTPDALSEAFVSRFLTFTPGSVYSSDALIRQRQNFNDSQYFSRVGVSPQLTDTTGNAVPVLIDLGMRPRKAYSAGAGINTDTGPRLRLSYEDRYFNRSGHRLSSDMTLSPMQQEPSLTYVIPLSDPVNDSLRLSGGFQRQESESYITNTFRIGASYRSLVGNDWIQNIFLNLERERAELTNVSQRSLLNARTNSLITGINWSRTRSDDPIYPTRGWRLFGQASGAHDDLFSDITFAQLYGSAKLVQQFGPGRFLLRGEAATTLADELLELPVSVRFFTGGDTTVRGYQFGELGATNSSGEVVGGKHLLVGSAEYDVRVTGNWFVAAFIDAGNSFRNFDDIHLKRSAGLGLRWLSPIGPIRIDVARALESGGSYRLHITMGPDL
jgi:translocation and assembly module TamA